MKATNRNLKQSFLGLTGLLVAFAASATTYTNVFFDASQTATTLSSNFNAITIQSGDYRFTYSVDGYFTGGVGLTNPVGRFFSVLWPAGIQAQSITAGPQLGNGANITIKRADGKPFGLQAFTGKILLNTAGAGSAFEIMPLLNGNDGYPNPLQYDCTGYSGMSFPYTPALMGFDTYQIHMWGDFALTALTFIDTNAPLPVVTNFTISASASPANAGSVSGAGNYPSNSPCTLTAQTNAGWGFKNWTQNGTQVSTSPTYTFTAKSNRTLVANFVPAFSVATAASPTYGGSTTAGGMFNSNSIVSVTAAPASGFQLVNWTDWGAPVSTATNYSFTITSDHQLQANFAPLPQTAVFDFDTGTPVLVQGQGMPATQANNGLTASFTTTGGGWSMQSRQSSIIGAPPSFAGLFLYPSTWGSTLQIQFSAPVTDFAFDFMTGELAAEYNTAGTMRVTAYTNSTATPSVGAGTALGTWAHGSYPDGHLSFHSATPFTILKVDMAPVALNSGLFFLDNLVAQRALVTTYNVAASASPTNSGFISGTGSFAEGATVLLTATANFGFNFAHWTENGTVVETLPDFTFIVSSNRTLVAHFTTNAPPVAVGGTFYQLTGHPLALNIADLLALDYDPEGNVVSLASVSPTNSLGLALSNDAAQIFVPASTMGSSFSYTIDDGNGGTATGTATIAIIANVTSTALALDLNSTPGTAMVSFSGVPWYPYLAERATNALFLGTTQTWPVQAWADGSITISDDFTDLGGKPPQSFYRLTFTP